MVQSLHRRHGGRSADRNALRSSRPGYLQPGLDTGMNPIGISPSSLWHSLDGDATQITAPTLERRRQAELHALAFADVILARFRES